jgi:hypothetical protein
VVIAYQTNCLSFLQLNQSEIVSFQTWYESWPKSSFHSYCSWWAKLHVMDINAKIQPIKLYVSKYSSRRSTSQECRNSFFFRSRSTFQLPKCHWLIAIRDCDLKPAVQKHGNQVSLTNIVPGCVQLYPLPVNRCNMVLCSPQVHADVVDLMSTRDVAELTTQKLTFEQS